jgi:precorrin-6A/cobalt-precorrin-6A reductase
MTKQKRVLILGGTQEAASLAAQASRIEGIAVISSLAGRTLQPLLPSVNTRMGGFGGAAGLTDYLKAEQIDWLIDATHPFATQISWNAAIAATAAHISRLMLVRPPWQQQYGDRWLEVDSNAAAAQVLPGLARRVFLTIGRQELASFAHLPDLCPDLWFLMRMIDPPLPNSPVPPGELLLARGPFAVEAERSLLQRYKIEAIVSKNSGGDATYAKIIAARELGLPVVMVQRSPLPEGERVTEVEIALRWLGQRAGFVV